MSMLDTQAFFEALADPIRRRILAMLLEADERCVCDLHGALDAPQPKVSRHLAVLREAGLVLARRDGVWMRYRIHPQLPAWALRVLIHMQDGMGWEPATAPASACDPQGGLSEPPITSETGATHVVSPASLVRRTLVALVLLLGALTAHAFDLIPTPVADGVYALIGPTGPRTYDNDGLNANLGFVVTGEGVVLVDSGASRLGAERVAAAIRGVTDQPVRWVINTGSQDHRWLGNGWFADQGAQIIALQRTVDTQRAYGAQHLAALEPVLKERLAGTQPVTAPAPLPGDRERLTLGGVEFELIYPGDAHFPGDALLWLPGPRVLFTGDLVYVDRLLGVLPDSHVQSWRDAFRTMEALNPRVLVPGHGPVCDLAKARRDTGDYLDWLVQEVGSAQANWEPIEEVVARLADAPQFSHLENYAELHRPNINRAYLDFERR